MTVDTAHAAEAIRAVATPNQSRSGRPSPDRPTTMRATPTSVRSVPAAIGLVTGSSSNAAARRAAPTGYVVAIVIAGPRPMARVLSKNTVSPTATAATMETDKSANEMPDMVISTPGPSIADTSATRSAPAIPERTALIVTEPYWEMTVRASRLVRAQATAEPSAHSAP